MGSFDTDPLMVFGNIDPDMAITPEACIELALIQSGRLEDLEPQAKAEVLAGLRRRMDDPEIPTGTILEGVDRQHPGDSEVRHITALALDEAGLGLISPDNYDVLLGQPGAAAEQVSGLTILRRER